MLNESQNNQHKVISSLIWKMLERGGTVGIQFIITLVLARTLNPSDYGVIALTTVFITLASVFVQTGFQSAIIQKKTVDDLDYSSVFFLNIVSTIILYLVLFFSAPIISNFYKTQQLTDILRILGITLFFGAVNGIQSSKASRNMEFKSFFFSSIGGVITSGTVGITLAFLNYGVWALVAQQLTSSLVITTILWFTVKWRPSFRFSLKRIKELFHYGWKLLVSGLIDTVFNNLYGLIIGKLFNATVLGLYNRGQQIPNMIILNINASIQSVLFPVLSKMQNEPIEIKKLVRRSIISSCYLIIPLMMWMAASAKTIVLLVLTEKWMGCVPFIQMTCFSLMWWPIHTANLQAINALGRSDIFLKLEILKKTLVAVSILITYSFGVYVLVMGQVILSIISILINAYPNQKLISYSIIEQLKDITGILLLSLVMGITVFSLDFIQTEIWIKLLIQMFSGLIIYWVGSKVFKIPGYSYLMYILSKYKKNRI